MADTVLLEKCHPGIGFRLRDGAVAVRAYGTPFGDKQRHTTAQRRLRLAAQELAMRAGVEVQGVGNVGPCNRIRRRHIHILRPGRRADDNQIIRIDRADCGDDGLRIRFDHTAPGNLQGLIIDFIDDMVPVAVASGHILEETDGLSPLAFGIVRMPVDNDV